MKKKYSFLVLGLFFIILFFQNFMISFADTKINHKEMETNMHHTNIEDCFWEQDTDTKDCNHECCYTSNKWVNINFYQIKREKKEKNKYKNYLIISIVFTKKVENKNLIKITSPPYYKRKVKNYSYSQLIKIIKSNT